MFPKYSHCLNRIDIIKCKSLGTWKFTSVKIFMQCHEHFCLTWSRNVVLFCVVQTWLTASTCNTKKKKKQQQQKKTSGWKFLTIKISFYSIRVCISRLVEGAQTKMEHNKS